MTEDDHLYVVEGGSGDDSAVILAKEFNSLPQVTFIPLQNNGGFAASNNVAISQALSHGARYIFLQNPDTILQPNAIKPLIDFMESDLKPGLAGSRLINPETSTQYAARRFHNLWNEIDDALSFGPASRLLRRWSISMPESDRPHTTDWVPGAALMVRAEVFETIGLLDDQFFLYFEEVDFCLRAKRAGFNCWYVPESTVIHLVGQSSGVTSTSPKRRPRTGLNRELGTG